MTLTPANAGAGLLECTSPSPHLKMMNRRCGWDLDPERLPPLQEGPQNSYREEHNRSSQKVLNKKGPPPSRKLSKLPTLQRTTSLMAYDPIIVQFVKNGDKFFEGVKINISQRNMRCWDGLLSELSRRIELPAGVRHVYTPKQGHRIKSLSQLEDKKTYVCGSNEPFKKMNYNIVKAPNWKTASKVPPGASVSSIFSKNYPLIPFDPNMSFSAASKSLNSSKSHFQRGGNATRLKRHSQGQKLTSISEPVEKNVNSPSHTNESSPPSHLNNLTLTIYQNGPPPRESVTLHIDRDTTESWEKAKLLISENLKTVNGNFRLYKLDGKEVESLSHLWGVQSSLIAAGEEETFDIEKFLIGSDSSVKPAANANTIKADKLSASNKAKNAAICPGSKDSEESIEGNSKPIEEESETRELEDSNQRSKPEEINSEPRTEVREPLFPDKESTEGQKPSDNQIHDKTNEATEAKIMPDTSNNKDPATPLPSQVLPLSPSMSHRKLMPRNVSGRPRRLSLLNDNSTSPVSGSSPARESPLFLAKHRTRGLLDSPFLHPQTPYSDFSVGQSVVDMTMPKRKITVGSSIISNLSSENLEMKSRNVAIQTDFVEGHLSMIVEPEEIHEIRRKSIYSCETEISQTEATGHDLDISAAEVQLYKQTREKYHVGMVIMEGSFVSVKYCKNKENKDFLLRVIHKAKTFGCDDKIEEEVKIMKRMRHKNVLAVLDYWECDDEMSMVMEPIEGGDLFDAILHCQHFSEADGLETMRQLGLALVYLHANRIVHRGIKPESIFLTLEVDGRWIVKLAGFNLATTVNEPLSLVCGNPHYRAPEMTSGRGYGTKADVWSAGVIAYVLLSGTMPFGRKNKNDIHVSTMAGKFAFPSCYWKNVTGDAKDFIRQLLVVSPVQRYSSSQLMQHSWFKKSFAVSKSSDPSKKLFAYLTTKAAEKVALVPTLTATALDQESNDPEKKQNR